MDNAAPVGITQSRGNLLNDAHNPVKGTYLPLVRQVCFKVLAFNKFHHHVVKIALHPKIMHLDDIRVAERGNSLGLPLKSLLKTGFGNKFTSNYLERPINGQAGVKRFINVSHPASSQLLGNLILPNNLPDKIGHFSPFLKSVVICYAV